MMSTTDGGPKLDKWAEKLLLDWLDKDEYIPSIKMINDKEWQALPIPDFLLPMEAEWLAEAVNELGVEEMLGLNFGYKNIPIVEKVDISRDAILNYVSEYNYHYCILTSRKIDFLIFIEQGNDYLIICGCPKFIQKAYKCSLDTAKKQFFEFTVDSYEMSENGKQTFSNLWAKYEPTLM